MHSLLADELARARSAELREGAHNNSARDNKDRKHTPARRRLAEYWSRGDARYEQSLRRPRFRAG